MNGTGEAGQGKGKVPYFLWQRMRDAYFKRVT